MSKAAFVVYILALLPSITIASKIGGTFVDIFTKLDEERWDFFNDTQICYDSTCTYLTESNLHIHKARKTSLQLSIRNDCDEPKCCLREEVSSIQFVICELFLLSIFQML